LDFVTAIPKKLITVLKPRLHKTSLSNTTGYTAVFCQCNKINR